MLLAAVAAVLLRTSLFTWAGNLLVEDDSPQKAPTIVVLGGDGSGTRIVKAAELAQGGYSPEVIVDGPRALMGNESEMTILYAQQKGFPQSLFHGLALPPKVNSTHNEAIFVGKYLKSQGIHKILLVTSNYHTHRAAWLFRELNPGLWVIPVAAPDPDFTPDTWWKSREGQKIFFLEWAKTFAAWLRI